MEAIVLVGGLGTRLRPLTNTIPKQLLEVAGVPMIERLLAALAEHGVERAVLSMGYLPDPFIDAYPDRRVAGVELAFAVEPDPLDTGGAIKFAAASSGISGTFLAVNGDILSDLDVTTLISVHRERGAEATVHLTPVEDPSRFGVVVTDASGRVTEWVEKPTGTPPSHHINGGTYVLEPSVLDRIADARPVSIERVVFPALLADGRLYAWTDDAYWLDAGTPAAFLQANLDLVDGVRRSYVPGAVVDGSVRLEGAVVVETARVERSVLGRRTVVEEGAVVQRSVVLDGARVSARSVVVDSIIGPGATVGEGASLSGCCVVAAGAQVEPGSVLERVGVP